MLDIPTSAPLLLTTYCGGFASALGTDSTPTDVSGLIGQKQLSLTGAFDLGFGLKRTCTSL